MSRGARLLAAGPHLPHNFPANFLCFAGFLNVRYEPMPQSASAYRSAQISVVQLAAQGVPEFAGNGVELISIATHSLMHRLFARGSRKVARLLAADARPSRIQDSRTEVGQCMLKRPRIKAVFRCCGRSAGNFGVRISAQRQSPASMMQKARGFLSRAFHLKFANVKRIDRWQINRTFSFDLSQQSFNSIGFAGNPQKQSPQTSM